jgi:hypothetical protein
MQQDAVRISLPPRALAGVRLRAEHGGADHDDRDQLTMAMIA